MGRFPCYVSVMNNPTSQIAHDSKPQANVEAIKRELEKDFSIPSVTTPQGALGVHLFFLARNAIRYRVSVEFEFLAELRPANVAAWVREMIETLSPEHPSVVVLRNGRIRHQ